MKKAITEANKSEDPKMLSKILDHLRFNLGMNYEESKAFFIKCDPTIDADRFEELCQIVDSILA
jgi:hypothetical protein